MKKRNLVKGLTVLLLTTMVLAGCGSSAGSSKSATADFAAESAYDAPAAGYGIYDNMVEESAEYDASGGDSSAPEVADNSRKLITTVNLTTETEKLDETMATVENKVKGLGGYIESSNIYNGSTYSGQSSRNADLTIRIPAKNLDEFVEMVEGSTNITRKSTNVEDITLQYVDIASKKNALKTEESRLLEILSSAETVEDLITVEDKLADVRYELESIESQLRSYDNKVDYSTVYLSIEEVVKFTPVEKEGALSRMGKGFMENLEEVGMAIVEFFVWLVSHLPQIILFVIIVIAIILIIKKVSDSSRKKRIAKAAKMYQAGPMMNAAPAHAPVNGAAPANSVAPVNGAAPTNNAAPVNGQAPVGNTAPANDADTTEKKEDGNKQ